MAFARTDDYFGAVNFLDAFGKQGTEVLANLGFDAAGAPIRNNSFGTERAKVGARRNVAALEFETQAEGLDHTAPHLILDRIVTE
jgi:hypothetical protein